jgi:hypothetical protein
MSWVSSETSISLKPTKASPHQGGAFAHLEAVMPTETPDTSAPESAETLASLLRRFGDRRSYVRRVKFADALARGDDPFNMLPYLATLGHAVAKLDDLLVINDAPDEEELHCFVVAEGIAVSMQSDRMWLLFEAGDAS